MPDVASGSTLGSTTLPPEIWQEIISHIGAYSFFRMPDLLACCLTCKSLVNIARKFIYQTVEFRHGNSTPHHRFSHHDYPKFISALKSNETLGYYVKTITLREGRHPDYPNKEQRAWLKAALPALAPHLNQVQNLKIHHLDWDYLNHKAADSILQNLNEVQNLGLFEAKFPFFDTYARFLSSFPRLRHLRAHYIATDHDGPVPIMPLSPFIQEVDTAGNTSHLWSWIYNEIPNPRFRQIRSTVSIFSQNESLAGVISHCGPFLTNITLNFDCQKESFAACGWDLSKNSSLKTLELNGPSGIQHLSPFLRIVTVILDTIVTNTIEEVYLSIGLHEPDTSDILSAIDTIFARPNWLVALRELNIRRPRRRLYDPLAQDVEIATYFPRLSGRGVLLREVEYF